MRFDLLHDMIYPQEADRFGHNWRHDYTVPSILFFFFEVQFACSITRAIMRSVWIMV